MTDKILLRQWGVRAKDTDIIFMKIIDFFLSVDVTDRKDYQPMSFEYNPGNVYPLMYLTTDYLS